MDDPDESASGVDPKSQRSIAALLSDLALGIGLLVRQEMALLKAEMAEALNRLGKGLAAIAIGGLIAFSGWLALLAAAVLGLATVMAPWLAAAIVGLAALAAGFVSFWFGFSQLDAKALGMRRTLASLRKDEAWLKDRLS
jgi:hypothetical protein